MSTWIASASKRNLHVQGVHGGPMCGNYGGHWKPVQEHVDPSYFDSFRRCPKCIEMLSAARYRDPRGEYAVSTNDEVEALRAQRCPPVEWRIVPDESAAPSEESAAAEQQAVTRDEPTSTSAHGSLDVVLGEKDGWITRLTREAGKYQHLVIEQTLTSNPRVCNRVVITDRLVPRLIDAMRPKSTLPPYDGATTMRSFLLAAISALAEASPDECVVVADAELEGAMSLLDDSFICPGTCHRMIPDPQ